MISPKTFLIVVAILSLWTAESKPIYDFKKSYVSQLTPLNFKDQV